jgi:hypothetical protein
MSSPRLNPDKQIAKLTLAKSSPTLNPTEGLDPPHVFPGSSTLNTGEPPPQVTPDFDRFAVTHPWIGQEMGKIQSFPGGFGQQFQGATLYGVYGGNPNEVHDAIRDKYLARAGFRQYRIKGRRACGVPSCNRRMKDAKRSPRPSSPAASGA